MTVNIYSTDVAFGYFLLFNKPRLALNMPKTEMSLVNSNQNTNGNSFTASFPSDDVSELTSKQPFLHHQMSIYRVTHIYDN